jgi:endonuclease G
MLRRLAALISATTLSASAFAAGANGFEACAQDFYQGFAPRPTTNQPGQVRALCFDDFAVLHSGQSKTPIYAAEHLTRESLSAARGKERTNKFYAEARLPAAERATLEDYSRSGWDRGHNAPAGDRATEAGMSQSFSLSNMNPQAPLNNRGVWAKNVEKPTRQYAMRSAEGIYVLTGPIYRGQVTTIGAGRVWVPNSLFKLVYDPAKKRAWVYVVDNTDAATVTGTYSYADLVRMTGMEYLPPGTLTN